MYAIRSYYADHIEDGAANSTREVILRGETIPADGLECGDRVLVPAGAAFPADGVIHAGTTEVDEAP